MSALVGIILGLSLALNAGLIAVLHIAAKAIKELEKRTGPR